MASESQEKMMPSPSPDITLLASFHSIDRTSKHKHRWRRFDLDASGKDPFPRGHHLLTEHPTPPESSVRDRGCLSVPNDLRQSHIETPQQMQQQMSHVQQHHFLESSSQAVNQFGKNTNFTPYARSKWAPSLRMRAKFAQPSTPLTMALLFFLFSMFSLGEAFICPADHLIHRLTVPNGASVNRQAAANQTPECDCTTLQEGGWEINCYATTNEADEASKPKAAPSWSASKDFESPDYNIDYNILMVSFSVRYVIGRQLKITCDHGSPIFKPALFQGFGIESIDTFVISNCELPLTLPLSIILHRTTPKHAFSISSRIGESSYTISNNETAANPNEGVAPIRALYLTTSKSVAISQLNTLLSDLESLEQLTLNDFNLHDVDDYLVESMDRAPLLSPDNSTPKRRIIRNVNESTVGITTKPTIDVETTTTMLNLSNVEMIPVEVTTLKPISELPATSRPEFRSMETNVNETNGVAPETTTMATPIEMTTKPPEMEMNGTRMGKDSPVGNEMPLVVEEESNDVNVENKPIVMLDENALNFARILPNLRILRLRHFIKESSIPNVLFQIIKGLHKLEYLELDSNTLHQIPANALAFPNLKKLYLYKNTIKEMSDRAFTNLSRLEILDLSQNQINDIEEQTLAPLSSLLYLSLRNNQLGSLSETVLQANIKLVSLDLSQNRQLEPLPGGLLKGFTSLANLSLAYCNMSQMSTNVHTLLRNVPNLSRLDLKGNQLSNLTLTGLFAWNSKLSKIDVSANQITEINSSIFSSNSSALTELNLSRNRLTELPENLFSNVRNLRKLTVAFNRLEATSPMTFIQLRSLEELDLSRNRIGTINSQLNQLPFGIGGNLRRVDLSYNNLTDFESEIYAINWHLYLQMAELDLKHNHFNGTLIVPIFSASIEPVIDLDVSSNHFTSVSVKHLLVDLDFHLGESAYSDSGSTSTQSWETQVRLDNNPMHCNCQLFPFLNYTKTAGRLFSKNSHSIARKTVFILDTTTSGLTCSQPEELKEHPVSHLPLQELRCTITDERICPETCSCHYRSHDQAAIVDCDNAGLETLPKQLQLSRYLSISVEETTVPIPQVDSIILRLRNNSIVSTSQLPAMFEWSHGKVRHPSSMEIWLDHNNISFIEKDFIPANKSIENMPLLRVLSLRANSISYVPLTFLHRFEGLIRKDAAQSNKTTPRRKRTKNIFAMGEQPESKLYLGGNPINCYNEPMPAEAECYIRDLKTWLSTHPERVGDLEEIKCDRLTLEMMSFNETTTPLLVNMTDHVLCPVAIPPPNNGPILALSIVCVVLASSFFVVSVLYVRHKQTILAFIFIHLNPIFICLSFTEDDLDEDKIYDAFVSYSSSDRDIVMELIEKLEKPLDMSEANMMLQNGRSIHEGKIDQIVPENAYKQSKSKDIDAESGADGQTRQRLCIHERDWLPGNLISWNIVNSVQNSKRTILVLSPQFIKSIWFQVEFHTAYYQMLEDKMDRLIVIVRGELPPREELDKDLLFLLSTKTYLVWGEKWFWEKLYYAMPHKKNQSVVKFTKEAKSVANGKAANGKNGPLTGNGHKDGGMLKWPASKGTQADVMKEYVDKTIASHFQLNSLTPSNGQMHSNGMTASNPSRPAPKSLRNSGTLRPASQESSASNRVSAYDNASFINETNT